MRKMTCKNVIESNDKECGTVKPPEILHYRKYEILVPLDRFTANINNSRLE